MLHWTYTRRSTSFDLWSTPGTRKKGLRRLLKDKYINVVPNLFKEAHRKSKRNVHTPVFNIMGQAAMKAFFTREADELHNDKIYKLANS